MRLISWLVTLPIFVAVIVFVLQNRMQVSISFWPFDAKATLPISVLSLGLLILGFVMGTIVTGFSTFRAQIEARRLRKQVAELTDKLQHQPPLSCEPTILYKGRYQTVSSVKEPVTKPKWTRLFEK